MQYRELGSSGINVPVVIFGAWAIGGWYWGPSDDDQAINAIHAAIGAGINCIDTAPMYGCGHSEEIVGRAIRGKRDKVIIATKCGMRWDLQEGEFFFNTEDAVLGALSVYKNLCGDSIRLECENSLRRLGIDAIDLYQCHWPDNTSNLDDTMSALLELQQEGKIRAIGVSNFTSEMIAECLKNGSVASDQPKYNLLQRGIENDILPYCEQNSVGIIAYSPMEKGLLTGKVTMDRSFVAGDFRAGEAWFQPNNRKRVLEALQRIEPLTAKYKCTYAQLAVHWVIRQPGVTSAIVGARNPDQVRENARASELNVEQSDLDWIRTIFQELGGPLPI